nr:ATP-binding cassette domain-containing protein [Helicobacter pylori]
MSLLYSIVEKIYSITFENISFSYSNSKPIFENFNLSLSTNKIYALVGRNASGKSTLINLLLGFYTPNLGQIIINNKYPLQDLELNSYHQQMSAIFQNFSLYAGYSVDDNLFMQNNITKEQLNQKREILNLLMRIFKIVLMIATTHYLECNIMG